MRIVLGLVLAFSVCTTIYAATAPYTVLAPLPGTTIEQNCTANCTTDLQTYLPGVFWWSIGLAAAMAFVMITYGGLVYMTSDAIYGKEDGRKYIENALWGLLLVIGAWVILNTLNPQILSFHLTIPRPTIVAGTAGVTAGGSNVGGNVAGTQMTQAQKDADKIVRDALTNKSTITVYRGVCDNGQTTGCVDLNGLSPKASQGIRDLAGQCHCSISITGGTEPGHTTGDPTHDRGVALDFESSGTAVQDLVTNHQANRIVSCTFYTFAGGKYLWEPKGAYCGGTVPSSGNHWHAEYW